MRTQTEVLDRARLASKDFLGFGMGILMPYLDFGNASEFLKEGVTREEWDAASSVFDREAILSEAAGYMEFGWGKCLNHRGISAGRTIDKMKAWMWLLGEDDLVTLCDDDSQYAQYGAPVLKGICEKMGWPIPDSEEAQRMMRGEPCGADECDCCDDDDCGCGS